MRTILPSAILMGLLCAIPTDAAVAFVSTRAGIDANDTLDWADLGAAGASVAQPFTLATSGGHDVTVSKTSTGSFLRLDQTDPGDPDPWNGNFTPGDALLYTYGTTGPITLSFDQPVQGVGIQIQKAPGANPSFIASIQAFDLLDAALGDAETREGISNSNSDGSALFMGLESSTKNIARIDITVLFGEDFAVNHVSIQIPEPDATVAAGLLVCGVVLVAHRLRSRHCPGSGTRR